MGKKPLPRLFFFDYFSYKDFYISGYLPEYISSSNWALLYNKFAFEKVKRIFAQHQQQEKGMATKNPSMNEGRQKLLYTIWSEAHLSQ